MRALIFKELRALLPVILLIAAFEFVTYAATFAREFADMNPLRLELDPSADGNDLGYDMAAFAILLGIGLLVRERA